MTRQRELPQLTHDQAIVLTIVTGSLLIQPFKVVLDDVSERLGRVVSPQEFNDPSFRDKLIDDVYRGDLMKLVVVAPPPLIVIGDRGD